MLHTNERFNTRDLWFMLFDLEPVTRNHPRSQDLWSTRLFLRNPVYPSNFSWQIHAWLQRWSVESGRTRGLRSSLSWFNKWRPQLNAYPIEVDRYLSKRQLELTVSSGSRPPNEVSSPEKGVIRGATQSLSNRWGEVLGSSQGICWLAYHTWLDCKEKNRWSLSFKLSKVWPSANPWIWSRLIPIRRFEWWHVN